jgi:hypothetical protein
MGRLLSGRFELPYTRGVCGLLPQFALSLFHDLQENIGMEHMLFLYAA